jgi:heptosyltransferase-1
MTIATLPDLRDIRRLLIIRFGAIGDIMHALPVSAALGEAFPHLEITWIVEEISADLVLGNPYLKEVIVVPRARWKQGRLRSPRVWREYLGFLAGLRRRQFDMTLDLHGYAKSALMVLATGAPYRFGWWRLRDGSHLVSRALPRRPETVHRVDMFLDVVRALGVEPEGVRFPLDIPETARQRVAEHLCKGGIEPDRPYVVLNQAAGNLPRRWGAERYVQLAAALAQQHRLPCVLVGTRSEALTCEQIRTEVIAAQGGDEAKGVLAPLNLAGKTTLKELAALLDGCTLHVCGDTGSGHIAAALQRPVIGLYGGTDPAMWGPWGQIDKVLAHRELCHPNCTTRHCVYTPGVRADRKSAASETTSAVVTARCQAAISLEDVLSRVACVLAGSNVY